MLLVLSPLSMHIRFCPLSPGTPFLLPGRGALALLLRVSKLVEALPGEGKALPPAAVAVGLLVARWPRGLLHLLLLFLLHRVHGLLGHLLPSHPLDHVLLARLPVPYPDEKARGGIDRDGAAQDDCRQREWALAGVDSPGAGPEGDLQAAVEVEEARDGDH